jgi:hypothetical protein
MVLFHSEVLQQHNGYSCTLFLSSSSTYNNHRPGDVGGKSLFLITLFSNTSYIVAIDLQAVSAVALSWWSSFSCHSVEERIQYITHILIWIHSLLMILGQWFACALTVHTQIPTFTLCNDASWMAWKSSPLHIHTLHTDMNSKVKLHLTVYKQQLWIFGA